MNARTRASLAVAGVILLILLGYFLLSRSSDPQGPDAGDDTPGVTEGTDDSAATLRTAALFFPAAAGRLDVQSRELPDGDAHSRIAALVNALLEGPGQQSGLLPIFPAETVTLADVFVLHDDTAVVDLSLAEDAVLAAGSSAELLSLYSLVNTVVNDGNGIEQVVLLWAGKQPETFLGHIDTSRPLTPNRSLAASQ